MNEDTRWKLIAGTGLVTLSLALYTAHYYLFQDAHHILLYLVGDIAFIPIEVLIVTLIIDQMLEARERKQRMEKLNMVIGTFFSTTGTPLLARFAGGDPSAGTLQPLLTIRSNWQEHDFRNVQAGVASCSCDVSLDRVDPVSLREFLVRNEEFLIRIVENPMVFEHETFTDTILAISHLTEELKARENFASLPPDDRAHLAGDMKRAYSRLIPEWVKYMEYLQRHYPYLFSLALRKNPFDPAASVVIRKA